MALTEEQLVTLIAQLKEPEIHFPGNFGTAKRANALLMCLCQEAAYALSASAPSEQKPVACFKVSRGELCYRSQEDDDQSYGVMREYAPPFPQGTLFYTSPHPDYKAQRDALLDFANHIATSPKLVGTGWQEMAQTVVASVKGEE